MTGVSLPDVIAEVAEQLPEGHMSAWVGVLEDARSPDAAVEAALIDACPGFALGAVAGRLVEAWRRADQRPPGVAIALALRAAGRVCADSDEHRSTIVVRGPTSDAVPVRLTSEVAIEVIRAAKTSLLVVSFAAYGVAEVVSELAQALARGVAVDLVLETTVDEGGTLAGATGAAAAFQSLRGPVRFWQWPQQRRPVVRRSRAALHAKLIAADRDVALVGSANLTDRALASNLEIGVVLREPEAVRRIVRHFRGLMDAEDAALKRLSPVG
jgi:putative cardiolipin synthase